MNCVLALVWFGCFGGVNLTPSGHIRIVAVFVAFLLWVLWGAIVMVFLCGERGG